MEKCPVHNEKQIIVFDDKSNNYSKFECGCILKKDDTWITKIMRKNG